MTINSTRRSFLGALGTGYLALQAGCLGTTGVPSEGDSPRPKMFSGHQEVVEHETYFEVAFRPIGLDEGLLKLVSIMIDPYTTHQIGASETDWFSIESQARKDELGKPLPPKVQSQKLIKPAINHMVDAYRYEVYLVHSDEEKNTKDIYLLWERNHADTTGAVIDDDHESLEDVYKFREKMYFKRTYETDVYSLAYQWDSLFFRHSATFQIPESRYLAAKNRPLYRHHVFETFRDALENPVIDYLAERIHSRLQYVTPAEQFMALVALVQAFDYRYDVNRDEVIPEYASFVEETLVEGSGDCEDTAVLLASLLSAEPFGYETVLVFPPAHVAVGVLLEDVPDLVLAFSLNPQVFSVGEKTYLYIEPTETLIPGSAKREHKDESTYVGVLDSTHHFHLQESAIPSFISQTASKQLEMIKKRE